MNQVANIIKLIVSIIARKAEKMLNNFNVYTGRFTEDGTWEREGLADLYQGFVKVIKHEVETDHLGNVQLPPATVGQYEFIGGNQNRLVYLHPSFWVKYPAMKAWWDEKGDSAMLAAMFLRPGKLATEGFSLNLPKVSEAEVNDGLLAMFSKEDWNTIVTSYGLPEETMGAQVTIFNPVGAVLGKGMIRRTLLKSEEPTTFVNSWKSLPGNLVLDAQHMGILTTDSVYVTDASLNLQELTFIVKGKTDLQEWVYADLQEHIDRILVGEHNSVQTPFGYLSAIGFSAPDELEDELFVGQRGALEQAMRRYPVSRKNGWRGKVTGSEHLADREVLLPRSCEENVTVGDKVLINRNPNLPISGPCHYTVVGFVPGNMCVLGGQAGSRWNAILGGDFDGDDAVVLFRNPFVSYTEPSGFNLQDWKATGRGFAAMNIEDRLARWHKEVSANIGQFDVAIRYAIDLGVANPHLLNLAAQYIQFTISLKKRVGDLTIDPEFRSMMNLTRDIKEYTETYLLREYPNLTPEERAHIRKQAVMSPTVERIMSMVEAGLEQLNTPKSKFTLRNARQVARKTTVRPELMDKAMKLHAAFLELVRSRNDADLSDDLDMKSQFAREIRFFTQVTMPRVATTLTEEEWLELSAALCLIGPREFWLYSAHPKFLIELMQETYAADTAMLVGEHKLQVGDKVTIPALSRTINFGEYEMKVARGIIVIPDDVTATVTKVHPRSVSITYDNPILPKGATAKQTKVDALLAF